MLESAKTPGNLTIYPDVGTFSLCSRVKPAQCAHQDVSYLTPTAPISLQELLAVMCIVKPLQMDANFSRSADGNVASTRQGQARNNDLERSRDRSRDRPLVGQGKGIWPLAPCGRDCAGCVTTFRIGFDSSTTHQGGHRPRDDVRFLLADKPLALTERESVRESVRESPCLGFTRGQS